MFRVVYTDGGVISALGTGRLTTTAASVVMGNNDGGPVTGFQIDRREVRWTTPAGAIGAPEVRFRQSGTQMWSLPQPLKPSRSAVDISAFMVAGNWEVRVIYTNGGQLTHVGLASFTVNSPVVINPTASEFTGVPGAAGPKLVWDRLPRGTPLVEYFDGTGWLAAPCTLRLVDATGKSSLELP